MTFTVLIFTTDGRAFLTSSEKDPGVPCERALAFASGTVMGCNSTARLNSKTRQHKVQFKKAISYQRMMGSLR